MQDINKAFITAINALFLIIPRGSKKELAETMGLSTGHFSDILNERRGTSEERRRELCYLIRDNYLATSVFHYRDLLAYGQAILDCHPSVKLASQGLKGDLKTDRAVLFNEWHEFLDTYDNENIDNSYRFDFDKPTRVQMYESIRPDTNEELAKNVEKISLSEKQTEESKDRIDEKRSQSEDESITERYGHIIDMHIEVIQTLVETSRFKDEIIEQLKKQVSNLEKTVNALEETLEKETSGKFKRDHSSNKKIGHTDEGMEQ